MVNKLQKWVADSGGASAVAKELNVNRNAVYYWLNRKATPTPKTIQLMVNLSDGKLTFADIIRCTEPDAAQKKLRKKKGSA